MGLSRSTYYDKPSSPVDDRAIVTVMNDICDEFESYGYRRVGAELRHRGIAVNSKKVRRLMREHDLQPKRRKRFVATTDSNHNGPIFPDLVRYRIVDGPNQVWVADITYIAISIGFIYLAAILDAWSRRVVGYAISRSMDARLAVAALTGAVLPASRHTAAFTTRIEARNMRLRPTAACLLITGLSARWADVAIHMTTPKPRAL